MVQALHSLQRQHLQMAAEEEAPHASSLVHRLQAETSRGGEVAVVAVVRSTKHQSLNHQSLKHECPTSQASLGVKLSYVEFSSSCLLPV